MLSTAWRCSEGWMLAKSWPRQQPLVAVHVPGDVARVGHDLLVRRLGDEALLRLVEVALVAEGQLGLEAIADLEREGRGRLALWSKVRRWLGCLRRGRGAGEAQGERHAQRTDRVHAGSMQVAGRHEVHPRRPSENGYRPLVRHIVRPMQCHDPVMQSMHGPVAPDERLAPCAQPKSSRHEQVRPYGRNAFATIPRHAAKGDRADLHASSAWLR